MYVFVGQPFAQVKARLKSMMLDVAQDVAVESWHAQDVRDNPYLVSRELQHVSIELNIPHGKFILEEQLDPNMPWAEDHFQERVGGQPLNPAPSEAWWPYAVKNNEAHKQDDKFSHTYPERMWPKQAGQEPYYDGGWFTDSNRGIRFAYGDLHDVVSLMEKQPLTRQAYLPIWFPEDTGATKGQRVPCSLGYHFMLREGLLHCTYTLRSCDLMRYFTDDLYMASRLVQWVSGQLRLRGVDQVPGKLIVHIDSLHVFQGDLDKLRLERDSGV